MLLDVRHVVIMRLVALILLTVIVWLLAEQLTLGVESVACAMEVFCLEQRVPEAATSSFELSLPAGLIVLDLIDQLLLVSMIAVAIKLWSTPRDAGLVPQFRIKKQAILAGQWIAYLIVYHLFSLVALSFFSSNLMTESADSGYLSDQLGSGYIIAFLALAIFRVFIEELYFRGFLYAATYNLVGYMPTVLFVSIVFSAMHAIGGEYTILGVAKVFADSVFLTLCRSKTGSIYVPVLLHAVMNMVG